MSHVSLRRRLPLAPEARPIDRELRPIYAVWEVTLRCDLACRHCGSRAGHARPDELTTEEALDLVRQLAELGVKEVTLIGGEAYLRPDWLAIIEAVRGPSAPSAKILTLPMRSQLSPKPLRSPTPMAYSSR